MKKIKRAISLMLVMSMVVSLFAMTGYTASAAERPNSVAYTNGSTANYEYTASTSNILTVTPPTTLYVNESKEIQKTINKNTFENTASSKDTAYAPSAWATTDLNTNVVLNFSQTVDSATLTAVAIDANGNEETLNNIKVGGTVGSTSGTNLSGKISIEVAGTATKGDGSLVTTLTYRIDYTIGGKTYTTYAASYVTALPSYKVTSLQIMENTHSDYKHPRSMGIRMDFSNFLLANGFNVEANSINLASVSGYGLYSVTNGVITAHSTDADYNNSQADDETAYWVPDSATGAFKRAQLPTIYQRNPDKYTCATYITRNADNRTQDGAWYVGSDKLTQGVTVYYDASDLTVLESSIVVETPVDVIGAPVSCTYRNRYTGASYEHGFFNFQKLASYDTTNANYTIPNQYADTTTSVAIADITPSFADSTHYYPSGWGHTTTGEVKTQKSSITFNSSVFSSKADASYRLALSTRAIANKHGHSLGSSTNTGYYRTSLNYGYHFNFKAIKLDNAHGVISAIKANYVKDEMTAESWKAYRNQVVGAYSAIGNLSTTSADVGSASLATPTLAPKATVSVDNLKALIGTTVAKCGTCNATGENYYTDASWNAYQTALSTANNVANSISGAYLTAEAETKQTEVNNAGSALANAINALEIGEAAHEPYHNETPTVSSKANGTEANSALNAIITEKNLGGTAYASAAKASPAFVETAKGDETANSNVYLYTNDSVNTMYIVEASASLAKPVTISIRARSKHGTPYYYAAAGAKVSATSASTSTASDFVILNPTFKDNTSGPDSEMKRSFVEYQIIATGANGKQETYSVTFAYYNDDNNGTKLGVTYTDGNKWTSNGFGIRRVHDDAVRWWEFVGKDDARAYDKDFGSSAYGSFALKVSGYTTAAEVTAAIKNGSLSTAGAIVYGGNKTDSNVPVHDDYYFKADDAKSGDQYYVHLVDRFGNTCSELITIEKTDSTEPTVQSNGSSATVSDKGGSMIESLELTSNGEAYNGWTLSEDNNAVGNNTLSLSNLAPNATYSLTATDAAGNASTASLTADDNGNAKITVNNFSDLRYLEKDNYKVNRKTGEDKSVATVLLNGETVTINNNVTVSLWQRIIRALADFFNSLLGFKVA